MVLRESKGPTKEDPVGWPGRRSSESVFLFSCYLLEKRSRPCLPHRNRTTQNRAQDLCLVQLQLLLLQAFLPEQNWEREKTLIPDTDQHHLFLVLVVSMFLYVYT